MSVALSKSKFLSGSQCLKRLWLECHRPGLAARPDRAAEALFEVGKRVGELARQCFPGGVLVEEPAYRHGQAVARTMQLLQDPTVDAVFEGAFEHDGVRIRVDVLTREESDSWRITEVKSSTRVKDEHVPDLAVQHHVLAGCGVPVVSDHLMHIDNTYVYDGNELDTRAFLTEEDMTGDVETALRDVPGVLDEQRAVVARGEPPEIEPGFHCFEPHECGFLGDCTSGKPATWIKKLPRITRERFEQLRALGIDDIADIPDDFRLSAAQDRVRDCARTGRPWVSPDLRDALARIDRPLQFLDFETFMPAIPRYGGTRPYQTLPFQWSLHVLEEDGSLRHSEYLCMEDRDPRHEFAGTLLDSLAGDGSVLVYTAYESRIIRDLASHIPALQEPLESLISRMVDLCAFLGESYYHPGFVGSYSLKQVLPVMAPDISYADLSIRDGGVASAEYQVRRSTGRETAVIGVVGVEESLRLLWGKGIPVTQVGSSRWMPCARR